MPNRQIQQTAEKRKRLEATGKTYTFIKTMYELNKVYGFKKFVVVVPSVAIREGTMKNLQITRSHFAADYANVPCVPILYNGDKLIELRHFAQSDALREHLDERR